MKKLLLLIPILICMQGYSQSYVDEIAKESCECISGIDNSSDLEELSTQLGLCILQKAEPYRKKLKKDYNIDFNHIDTQGEELGRVVAVKMISHCPESLMALAELGEDYEEQESEYEEVDLRNVSGEVTKIDTDLFVVFSVLDGNGKTSKYYWMSYINSEDGALGDYNSLIGEKVEISYQRLEFYDPKIDEYRLFNVIASFERE